MSKRYQFDFGNFKGAGDPTGSRVLAGSRPANAQLAFENIAQGLDRQFHEQKRLGNEVVAAAQRRAGAAFEVGQSRYEYHRCDAGNVAG